MPLSQLAVVHVCAEGSKALNKTVWILSAGVALVLAGTVTWLLNKPPTADCNAEAAATHAVHKIRATKVVVQPWLGPHHVYGIFVVPNGYEHNSKYAVTLTVRGLDHYVALHDSPRDPYVDGAFTEPGHRLLRGYVPTRVALWFLVNGLFGDLQRACNWALVSTERTS
jgi:hypothetical protein